MLSVESRPEGSCEDTNTNRPVPDRRSSRVVSPFPSSLSKKIEISHAFPNVKCHLAGAADRRRRTEEKRRQSRRRARRPLLIPRERSRRAPR